jgi:mRNA interferase RelE/StbE
MSNVASALAEADRREYDVFDYEQQCAAELRNLWTPLDEIVFAIREVPSFSREASAKSQWALALTPTFRKSVGDVDKKLQGRILSAISELSESPMAARGDTIKPLVGERKGLWRYRLGDFRLVYEPRDEEHLVVLLEFGARGGIYDQ